MYRILVVFLFLIIGFCGALLVTPNFINWNEYRENIVEYVFDKTGRNLEIRGNIELEILPSPALLINGVHVANIEGTATSDTLTIKTIEVRMALVPLLSRHLKINTIKLVEPILNIEIFPDGSNNLGIETQQVSTIKPSNITSSKNISLASGSQASFFDQLKINSLSLSIDNFYVQKGLITYRDDAKGHSEKVKDLNGQFSLASSSGPMESSGSVTIRGMPITYVITTGSIMQDRTLPLNFIFKSNKGNSNLHFSGALTQINKSPEIKGKLKFNSENLALLVSSIDDFPQAIDSLNNTLSVVTSVAVSVKGGIFSNIILKLGSSQGMGTISFKQGDETNVNVSFSARQLNIDALLQSKILETQSNTTNAVISSESVKTDAVMQIGGAPQNVLTGSQLSLKSIPSGLNAMFDISIGSLIFHGATVRQVKVNANLDDREITISQASALLPGNTDVGLQGIIFDEMKSKFPRFEGTADFTTNNLRKFLNWTGIDFPKVSANRLRKLTVAGKVSGNEKKLSFHNILAQIDDTKIDGAFSMIVDKRMKFDVDLGISQVNLDSYLPGKLSKRLPSNSSTIENANTASVPKKNIQTKSQVSSAPFSILHRFDANLDIKVDNLVFKNLPIKKIALKATLDDKKLTISTLKFAKIAGLSAKLAGNIMATENELGLREPSFNDLTFSMRGKSLVPALAFFGIKPAIPISRIGPVNVSGTLHGKLKTLDLLAELSFSGGRMTLNGKIRPFSKASPVQAQFSVFHPNLSRLMKDLIPSSPNKNKHIGGVKLSGLAEGNLTKLNVSNLSGTLGDIKINGIIKADLAGKIPRIDANLITSSIAIDNFIIAQYPASPNTVISGHRDSLVTREFSNLRITPASYNGLFQNLDNQPPIVVAAIERLSPTSRWANNVIDISLLRQFSGNINLRSESIRFQEYKIDNVDLKATISDGVFDLKSLTGDVYDGTLELDGEFSASDKVNKFKTRFKVINVNTGKFLKSLGTEGFRKGALDMVCEYSTFGNSAFKLVSELTGNGTISVRGLDVGSKAEKGSAMSGLANLFLSLQKFSSTILGERLNSKRTNFNTSFTAAKGIISFEDMTLKTGLGNGAAKGLVDIPNWKINTNGEIKLSQNILSQVFFKKSPKLILLPFKIKGQLDDPHVKLDTSEITKGGIRLPSILNKTVDKLKRKKGVNTILDNIFPKVGSGNQKLSPTGKVSNEDFFKSILKELVK